MECATLTVASWILQEKSVFEIVCIKRLYRQNILWTSYKILFTIKSGGLCYQNYLKYIISNYMEKDLECAVISTVAL